MATRLTAEQRKRQLIGIGLQLLIATSLDELSLDLVAQQAGISRSLLFHHFPTKRDYYLAVVRAASRRMLHAVEQPVGEQALGDRAPGDQVRVAGAGAGAGSPARLRGMTEGLVAFIRRRREPYLAFVRGSAGGDEAVRQINAVTRDELIARFAAELGLPADDEPGRFQVRGWLAYTEELVLTWTQEHATDADDPVLVDRLLAALQSLLHPSSRSPD